jgi:hypothetical protein
MGEESDMWSGDSTGKDGDRRPGLTTSPEGAGIVVEVQAEISAAPSDTAPTMSVLRSLVVPVSVMLTLALLV